MPKVINRDHILHRFEYLLAPDLELVCFNTRTAEQSSLSD